MSLRIWLPLTEDLHNQGASNISFTGTNNTIDPNGKIGACTYLSTSAIIRSSQFTPTNIEASICGWIKVTSTNSGYLFGLSAGGATFLLYQLNATSFRLYGQGNYGSNVAHGIDTLEWHHYTLTYDGVSIKLYIDGNYKNERALEFDLTTTPCYFMIGARDNGSGGYSVHAPAAYYNDIRYYDHCLSPEEVREIANGLVLHYKLDASNENLLKDVPKKYVPTDYDGYQLNLKQNLTAGQAYTLQLWDVLVEHSAKTAAQMNLSVYWGGGNIQLVRFSQGAFDETKDHYAYASYLSITFTPTSTQASGSGATNAWLNLYNSVSNTSGTRNMKIGAWKLEEGSEATPWISSDGDLATVVDSSGYGNNTTVENGAIIVSDSAKYNGALQCDSTHYLTITNNMIIENNAPYAISCWFKSNDRDTSLQIQINGSTYTIEDQGINISGKATDGRHLASMSMWGGTYHTCDNQWHLCYSSFQNATLEAALDNKIHPAVLNNEENPLVSNQTNIQIGKNFNGQISDIRLYATSLLDSEIEKLYNIGMGMDNKNQIHTYEFNEFAATPQLHKTGVLDGLINEFPYCPYDPQIYVEPDGSAWIHIYHLNNPSNALFESTDSFETSVYHDEDRWFYVSLCNLIDKWELMIKSARTDTDSEFVLRWIQSASPMLAAAEDVTADKVTYITDGYDTTTWGGLYNRTAATYTYLNLHDGSAGHWCGAIGTFTNWSDSVATTGFKGTGTGNGITTGYVDLYLRVDNVNFTNTMLHNDINWLVNGAIER